MEKNCGLIVFFVSLAAGTSNGSDDSTLIPKPFFVFGGQKQPLNIVCKNGEEPCASECINSATHICHETYYGKQLACNRSDSPCGLQCLPNNDTSYVCVGDKICLIGQQACSFQCYNPETEHCFNGKLCAIDQAACGYVCYNPEDKFVKCLEFRLCKINEEVCGFSGCYDPKIYKCDKRLQKISLIDVTTCGSEYANEAKGEICIDDKKVCKQGESLCGYQCYNSTRGKVCSTDNLVCKPDYISCGTDACYAPKSGQTCHKTDGKNYMICGIGLDYCHYNCYDKEKQDCLQPDPDSSYKTVCPKGQAICRTTLTTHADRYGCYNSAMQLCILNENGTVLRVWYPGPEISSSGSYYRADVAGVFCRYFVLVLLIMY